MCLVALPSSHCEISDENRRVQRDSCAEVSAGERAMRTRALPSPERHGWRRNVSFELRNGTWFCFLEIAVKTSPSAESDLLMFCASFSRSPWAPEREMRSDPARSIRWSLPWVITPVARLEHLTKTERIMCERDECSLQFVLPTVRWRSPSDSARATSSMLPTSTISMPGTLVPPSAAILTSSFLSSPVSTSLGSSRSRMVSL
mmetsp:Transcript_67162/g.160537  ORF Transcript_67162/g.160537 Transcript_67162/m.160537 type:complete len:203 (-) Transcript_67162:1892-2500(-)